MGKGESRETGGNALAQARDDHRSEDIAVERERTLIHLCFGGEAAGIAGGFDMRLRVVTPNLGSDITVLTDKWLI